jgi:uncharacterized protein YkwD
VPVDVPRTLPAVLVTVGALAGVGPPLALARDPQRPCANAGVVVTEANRSTAKAAVVCLVDLQRTSRGLPALRVSGALDRSAQHWSSSMVANDDFSHGADFGARIRMFGFDWSTAGENIATGYPTATAVVTGWMASLGHCQNILSPRFAFVGTGIAPQGISSVGTGGATWTQDFGLPIGWRVPSHKSAPADGCPYKV